MVLLRLPRNRLRLRFRVAAARRPQRRDTTVEGHTLLCTFAQDGETWKAYEDLRTRDGAITFVSATGRARVLPKTAEAVFPDAGPQHLGVGVEPDRHGRCRFAGRQAARSWRSRRRRGTACSPAYGFGRAKRARLPFPLEHHRGHARMQRHNARLSRGQYRHLSSRSVFS